MGAAQPAAGIQAAASRLDVVGILSIGDIFPPSFVESVDPNGVGGGQILQHYALVSSWAQENISANGGKLLARERLLWN